VLFCTTLAAARIMLPDRFEDFGQSMVAATLFTANIFFWTKSGYFAPAAESNPLLHTWSLSVEEQFYLLFPLVLVFIHRRLHDRWRPVLLPAALVSFLLCLLATAGFPDAAFYLAPMRGWELLIGSLLALGFVPRLATRPAREFCAAAGLLLVLCAVFLFSARDPFPGWRALLPCLGAALVIHAGEAGTTCTGRLLGCRGAVFIGLISYSLYLWHWPLYVFAVEIYGPGLSPFHAAAVVALSLLAAVASWRFVERPFRRKGGVAERKKLLQAAAGVMVLFTLAGSAINWTDGLPARFGSRLLSLHCDLRDYNLTTCFLKEDQPVTDWQGDGCCIIPGRDGTTLLWGDSFAAHYVPGITAEADRIHARILQYTAGGCAPVFGYDPAYRPRCREFSDRVGEVFDSYNVDMVLMAAAWNMALDNGMRYAQLQQTVERLRDRGLRVIIIGQSPRFPRSVQDIYNRSMILGHPVDTAEVAIDLEEINTRLRTIAGKDDFVDPSRVFCHGHDCRFRGEGGFFFWDDGHMTVQGSIMAAKYLFNSLGFSRENAQGKSLAPPD
jgi:peptidoglycan/LPS O-acetylase OafA/YrhL